MHRPAAVPSSIGVDLESGVVGSELDERGAFGHSTVKTEWMRPHLVVAEHLLCGAFDPSTVKTAWMRHRLVTVEHLQCAASMGVAVELNSSQTQYWSCQADRVHWLGPRLPRMLARRARRRNGVDVGQAVRKFALKTKRKRIRRFVYL